MTRASSPSVARNRDPILAVLRRVLPRTGRVLEIASGTGEHAVWFARAMPGLEWQTSDPDAQARASTAEWIAEEGLANTLPPLHIDVRSDDWSAAGPFDAIVAINMIHIAPWNAMPALFAGAARLLGPGGIVFLYGPYKRGGEHTAPSNVSFDAWLKERDPQSGVRDMSDVARAGETSGFTLRETIAMPANNFSLVFARTSSAS